MKKSLIIGSLAILGLTLASCDDFLDDNRYPLTQEINNPEFWNNESNVEREANLFLSTLKGYGNYRANIQSTTVSGQGDFYFATLSDDQVGRTYALQNWTYTQAPSTDGSYNNPYRTIRHAMLIMKGMETSSLDENTRNHYVGIARLFRALATFDLVKRYGDVIWINELVDLDSDGILYGAREDRDIVMDRVLEDLNFAVANISVQSDKFGFSKDMALAAKAEICLFEGTFAKYRTQADNGKGPDMNRASKYLNECVDACTPLMGRYTLANDYADIYKCITTGAFSGVSEIIVGKAFREQQMMHQLVAYTCSSTQISGITRDAFESFLFKDGKPAARTSENTSDVGEMDAEGNYSIAKLLDVRDGRLAFLTDPYVYCKGMTWTRDGAGAMDATTGYGVRKYDNTAMPVYNRITIGQNFTCGPIYWLSVVLCEYAEAKAELGTLNDNDLNISINKLYARAGLPAQTVASLNAIADPVNNMGVSSLIWEIRRCRRCELMCDNNYRYWDLIRWHQLELLDSNKHPNVMLGANMTASVAYTDPEIAKDLNFTNGYLNGSLGVRAYDKKYYLFPLPQDQLNLNPQLTQNPGW